MLGHLRQERHRGGARLRPGTVPDVSESKGGCDELLVRRRDQRGVPRPGDVYVGTDDPYLFGRVRVAVRIRPRSYCSFASFKDPDGNGWLFQEVTARLPDRGRRRPDLHLVDWLAAAPRRAAAGTASTRSGPAASTMRTGRLVRRLHRPGARPAKEAADMSSGSTSSIAGCLCVNRRARHSKCCDRTAR